MKYFKRFRWYTLNTFTPIKTATTMEEGFEKSLEKWELLSRGKRIKAPHSISCGLCDLFHSSNCVGCPVWKATRMKFCEGFASFNKYFDMMNKYKSHRKLISKVFAWNVLHDIREFKKEYEMLEYVENLKKEYFKK